ncbi:MULTISPECIES: bactofilin family protein [Bombella]|uniref:Polymer-forming cytoskeletal protein n=1 Tax=Bombella pollinis TaxID=2967337 RepID=A0ABT3WPH2_9PROT|nr:MULTISPECIES: polymer-forming cytoskeletal protein [Bombella]MCT6855238.1 polymer-forming cytoskeletal protein [Bombella apis]MCX5620025.1 polymer-forming cytoskeletal protein [Bombella pollinis]MUG05216.1 polymer-forming cytoskeletal protein [Bombella sp. ESL0378]
MSLPTPPSPMPGPAPRQRITPNRNNHQEKTRTVDNARTLIVHNSITIRGSIENIERLIVEGTVAVEHLTVKELIIAPDGHFHGSAEAGTAEVAGTLEGDLTVRNMLTIRASGRLLGNAECRRLQVDEGGQVTGKLGMITSALPGNKDHNVSHHHESEKHSTGSHHA